MSDRWKDISRFEQKLERKAAKGLLKLEKGRLKIERERDRLERHSRRRRDGSERSRIREERREQRRQRSRGHHRHRHEAHGPRSSHEREGRRARGRSRRTAQLSPEERAYRQAQRRANKKIAFMTHAVAYGSVLALILVATRSFRVTLLVATAWGIGLSCHYFVAVIAPGLRRRLVDEEVSRSVAQGVSQERRAAETRHERSLENLSASIAHEIRNPVTAAKSLVQQMGEDPVSSENVDFARVALDELDRVERSISHLLRYAREEDLRFEIFEMADVLEATVESFRDRIDLLGIEVERQVDTAGCMRGDPEKLRRVMVNLVGNAIDALEQGETPVPRLQIAVGENLAGTEVWVRIRDNGPGIDADLREKIFNPFFTTKDRGTGLGLALSKKVVDAHGGTMEMEARIGEESGTEFVLTFPKDAEISS